MTSPVAALKWILIVEDDVEFADSIKESLSSEGFHAIVSHKITDAMVKLNNQKFQCLLIDLKLEGNSGLRLVEYTRESPTKAGLNYNCPIIIMSGFLEVDVIKSMAGKVHAILSKPFDSEVLVEKINSVISGAPLLALKTSGETKSGAATPSMAAPTFLDELTNSLAKIDLACESLKPIVKDHSKAKSILEGIEKSVEDISKLLTTKKGI